ncbi:MAG: hypothetical protein ACI4TM_00240 [Candidatus Cryptobacteroides sp.]
MKRILTIFISIVLFTFQATSQTVTWSGKLDVQGTELSIVFHLDGDNPIMDSPDQGAKEFQFRLKGRVLEELI